MIKRLKPKSEFSRNVLTLMTGTTIAQALPIAAAPILTRIFTPEDFGLFAFYFAIVSILAVLATARYELAIVLPKRKSDAYQIVILSWLIATAVSVLTFFFIWIFELQIINLLENPSLANWLYWIPMSIFLMGIYQSLYYWFNREKEYRNMANSRVIQSTAMVTGQVGFGTLTKLSALGLILGHVVGQIIATLYMASKFIRNTRKVHKPHKLKQIVLARRYVNFPKFLLVAHTMNATSHQLPSILFNILFSATVAGFYLLVQRVIGAPMTIIGGAIGDVFRQQASQAYAARGECVTEYKSTLKKLFIISVVPFVIFIFIAPELFAIIFGVEWRVAGEYAQILAPMFFIQFISRPLSVMFLIAEQQSKYLIIQLFLFFGIILSFFTGKDVKEVLILISFSYLLTYLWDLYLSHKLSYGIETKI
ncbi:O-antigen translocase [Hydrogenovibrio crunogenus]|uniref:O-antigen translocase n=1 Tax=Hydrogenovibrio crunogenus TaxID=39765 RepID=A0A4P7P144_9GAMM|nr:oligosaccharide flippase family protein [Hydrogenovibrio crunogenus]QBZ83716.1 O-antigen translocase [Hydrogenovibrio crunogenus]